MKIVTANIGRNQRTAQDTEADFRVLSKKFGNAIIGFQEIDEADIADEHALLREYFGNKGQFVGFDKKVPLFIPKRYKIIDQQVLFGTKGIPRVSPTRWVTIALVKSRLKPWSAPFVVMNGHTPAGAFNNKPRERSEAERKDGWENVVDVYEKQAKKWVDQKGYTLFRLGDDNRMDMPKIHKREVALVKRGIDNVSYIEGSNLVEVIGLGSVELNSDHKAKWAKLRLKKVDSKRGGMLR